MRALSPIRGLSAGIARAVVLAALAAAVAPALEMQLETITPAGQKRSDPVPGTEGKALQANASAAPDDLEKIRKLIKEVHYAEAEGAARTLLAESEARSGRQSAEVAEVLDLLVEALFRGGKASNPETQALAERAVATKEKLLGPDHPELAKSLNLLGILFDIAGDHARAKLCFEQVLAIREKAFGPDHPEVAKPLHNLGRVAWTMGDYAAAKPFLERALAIRQKVLGPDHPQVAETLEILANVLNSAGDYAGARRAYERVLAIDEKTLGSERPEVASVLNNLGNLLREIGDFAGAKDYQERALAIYEKTLGPEHPQTALCLNNLGAVLWSTGDYAGAKQIFERSLALQEKVNGPEHPSLVDPLNNIADVLVKMGKYEAARPIQERAILIVEKALGPESPELPGLLTTLAELHHATGDYAAARPTWERAVAIWEKIAGPDYHELAFAWEGLAKVFASTNDPVRAAAAALRAEKISRDHLSLTAQTLPERQALAYATARTSGLDVALTLAEGLTRYPATEQSVWDAVSRSRALVLDEMAERHHAIAGTEEPEIAHLARTLASVRERLANLSVRGPGNDAPERYRARLDKTRQEKEQAERALAEKSMTFREEQTRSRVGLEEVVAALPSDSALVAFVRYGRYEFGQKQVGKPLQPAPSYLAFIQLSGQKEPQVVPLGSAKEIDGLVSRWRAQMAQEAMAPGHSPKRSEVAYRTTATELRRKVWDPLATHLQEAKRVFVVPDGALNLVSFAALPVEQASYLIDRGPLIHYLSAERDLVPPETRAKNEGLLALGAPAFDETKLFAALAPKIQAPETSPPVQFAALHPFRGNRSACGEFQSLRFEPLPASGQEAEEVVSLWKKGPRTNQSETPQVRGAGLPNARSILYLSGTEANEAAFKQDAPGRQVLHLATHGFFLGGHCASALEPSGKPVNEAQPTAVVGENPLLLSGLVLAGANHRRAAGPNEEDGILTAEEIAALDLDGVQWAVLSGCDTGIGEVRAGEGVFGLRRAFQVAGARTVIMSLWPVEDQAARHWIAKLYRGRFINGLSTAESVHEASLGVLRQRRAKGQSTHPFYWAGFVAAGDWH